MENESLLKTTLVTVAAMVGACTLFIGTVSVVAVLVTSRAVNPEADGVKDTTTAPAAKPPTAKS